MVFIPPTAPLPPIAVPTSQGTQHPCLLSAHAPGSKFIARIVVPIMSSSRAGCVDGSCLERSKAAGI
jgi:hypothetical protein